MNPGGLRFQDECCRHKVLDLIGDLALIGKPLLGHVIAERPATRCMRRWWRRSCRTRPLRSSVVSINWRRELPTPWYPEPRRNASAVQPTQPADVRPHCAHANYRPGDASTNKCTQAFWLSLIAGFTDAADGYVARWMGEVTRIGAYLDPIADKVLMTALYVCFGIAGLAPGWLVWLVVGRDIMILSLAGGGLFWKGIRDFPPTVWGKLCTLLQIAASLGIICGVRIRHGPGVE